MKNLRRAAIDFLYRNLRGFLRLAIIATGFRRLLPRAPGHLAKKVLSLPLDFSVLWIYLVGLRGFKVCSCLMVCLGGLRPRQRLLKRPLLNLDG